MLFMVTNRKLIQGQYSDEVKLNQAFEYQYQYNHKERGFDRFEKTGKKGFEAAILKELNRLKTQEKIKTPKIGIYIHGYNNDYQDSIDELFDLQESFTKFNTHAPITIAFSWPSSGRTSHYLSDREQARESVGAFTRFLIELNEFITKNQRHCFSTSFCIAHSMGCYMLRKGLEYLSDHLGTPVGRLMFDETVLLAPDLASKDIELDGKGHHIANFSRRVNVYYSKNDRALKASSVKRFGGNRLGRHGVDNYQNLAKNVVVVDAKRYANEDEISGFKDRLNKQVSVHSSYRYHPQILSDVCRVISSVERSQIPKRVLCENDEGRENHYRLIE